MKIIITVEDPDNVPVAREWVEKVHTEAMIEFVSDFDNNEEFEITKIEVE